MVARRLACILILIFVPGCATPAYETVSTPTPPPATTGTPSTPATPVPGDGPTLLVDSESADLRIVLEDHRVAGEQVSLFLEVTNMDDAVLKRMKYLHLAVEGTDRTLYFDFPAALDPHDTRRFQLDTLDSESLSRRPWEGLSFYYTNDTGGAYDQDGAVLLDLRGRGLPRHVS